MTGNHRYGKDKDLTIYMLNDEKTAYFFTHYKKEQKSPPIDSNDFNIQAELERCLHGVKGELISVKEISLNPNLRGIEVKAKSQQNEKLQINCQIFVDELNVYNIAITTTKGESMNLANIDRFFKSFKVIEAEGITRSQ